MFVRLKKAFPILLGLALVVVMSGSAMAASFDWDVDFVHKVRSRDWRQSAGTMRITSFMNCRGDDNARAYRIEVFRNIAIWPDDPSGAERYRCGERETGSFTGLRGAEYHFEITKIGDSDVSWHGEGVTRYPS